MKMLSSASLAPLVCLTILVAPACTNSQAPQLSSLPSTTSSFQARESGNQKLKPLVYISDAWGTSQGGIDAAGYPLNAKGPTAPVITIGGNRSGLEFESDGIAVSPTGSVAVDAQDGQNDAAVNVYPPGANGNIAPAAILACNGLGEAQALTFDSSGKLYAMNFNDPRNGSNSIFIFPAGSTSGCPSQTQLIFGNRTRLFGDPGGIAVAGNTIYAIMVNTNNGTRILEFPTSANGDERPTGEIGGRKTTLEIPNGIAIDAQGEILVVDNFAKSIDVFAADAHGDAAPIRVIKGSDTKLFDPTGIGISKDGRIFVANDSGNSNVKGDSITVFSPNASGDAKPIQVIPGGRDHQKSMIGNPKALAVYDP